MAMGTIFEHDRRNFSGATGGVSLTIQLIVVEKRFFGRTKPK
jgi:hypothetical protein